MEDQNLGERLDSWKAIARYLNCSVRTARRWEAEESLPVHRQMHAKQGRVFAYASELDDWRRERSLGPQTEPAVSSVQLGVCPATDEQASIAVLPFLYFGPDGEQEYIADGLTDEVITALSQLSALRVISSTSTRALKGTSDAASSIAKRLGVRYLLEGTVRQAGYRLRISVRLIDPGPDDRLWAERYDAEIDELFDIQERIARETACELELSLSQEEDRRLADRVFDDVAVWRLAVRANREAMRWRPDAIDAAVGLLEQGLAKAGDNAQLLGALGRAHLQYREAGIDLGDKPLQQAEHYADRIVALEKDASIGLLLRGWIAYSRGDIQAAVRNLRRTLDDFPDNTDALVLLVNCYLIVGRVSLARPIIARLLTLDPLTPLNRCMPGYADVLEGKPESAIPAYRDMYEMDKGNPFGRLFYIWVLRLTGEQDLACQLADQFPQPLKGSLPQRVAGMIANAGDGGATLEALPANLEPPASASDMFPRLIAHAFALAGQVEPAVQWLAVAVERGFINYPFLAEHDAVFSALRGEPRYERLLEQVHQRWKAFEA